MNSNGSFSLLIFLLPLLLIGWLFWTQNKRMKQMRQFSSSISVGDEVITSSGIFGTVRRLDDSSAWLEIAEGVTIRVDRRAIAMKQDAAAGASATGGTPATDAGTTPGDDATGSTPTGQ
jgi:preprotein translocase subunit YajC